MASTDDFKVGDKVTFRPGPNAKADVTAKVKGKDGKFLITVDDTGKERRVRPGGAKKA